MKNQPVPLTQVAFRAQLVAAGLHLHGADFLAAFAGAQRLRAQVAELADYLAAQPQPQPQPDSTP